MYTNAHKETDFTQWLTEGADKGMQLVAAHIWHIQRAVASINGSAVLISSGFVGCPQRSEWCDYLKKKEKKEIKERKKGRGRDVQLYFFKSVKLRITTSTKTTPKLSTTTTTITTLSSSSSSSGSSSSNNNSSSCNCHQCGQRQQQRMHHHKQQQQ